MAAGDGVRGHRDGPAVQARFVDPFGVAAGPDGSLFVGDAGDRPGIRVVSPDGPVLTLAGGTFRGFADGAGASARFDTPSGVARGADGVLYVADAGNHAIRRVDPDGRVTTLAGDGVAGYRDGPGGHARFNGPLGVAIEASGRILVADTYNDRVRAVATDGTVTTLAGAGVPGASDGPAMDATFDTPAGIAVDRSGSIYIADTGNGLVRVLGRDGSVWTAPLPPGGLVRPAGVAAGREGTVYVTDDRGRIVEIAPGTARTLAGSVPGFRDGHGSASLFRHPTGLAWLAPGRLAVADSGNALIRTLTARSLDGMHLPSSPLIQPRFDPEGFAALPLLWPVLPMEGPHEVAGTLGEARGGEGSERFHAGIDIRAPAGTTVHAVRDGVVTSPVATGEFGTLNEWMRIGPIAYVHVRVGRAGSSRAETALDDGRFLATHDADGRIVRMRVRRGARFSTGDVIATANRFNHVHLNVGPSGEAHNPLAFRLTQFGDAIPPTIAPRGIRILDASGQPLTARRRGRLLVSDRVRIVVDAWDRADGNRPSRRLGLYELGYQVLHRDGRPAPGFEQPRLTIRFDRLATDPAAAALVYAPGSGIPFYGSRVTRFLYTVTNSFQAGLSAEGFWDTADLAPGDYVLRVFASDIHGNVARANRDLPVTIEPAVRPR